MHTLPYWRLACLYFAYFAVVGGLSPYWGLYLEFLGLSPKMIGVVMAIPMLTRIVAPNIWGWVAARTGQPLKILLLGSFGAWLCFFGVIWRKDVAGLVCFTLLFSFFWNAILAQFEVLTLRYLKDTPERYGQIRSWGSIGFVVVVGVLGVVFDYFPIHYLPWFLCFFLACIFFSALSLPNQAGDTKSTKGESFFSILKQPQVYLFLITVFLIQLSLGIFHAFYSLYLDHYGYSKSAIGLLWGLGAVAEIGLFVSMPWLLKRYSINWLLGACIAVTLVRWFLLDTWPTSVSAVVIAQLFHAFTFGLTHAIAIEFVRSRFMGSSATQGQSFYSAIGFGAANAIGSLAGGVIWEWGVDKVFDVAMAVVIVAACLHLSLCLVKSRA